MSVSNVDVSQGIWDKELTDIIRFAITRKQWESLLHGVMAGVCAGDTQRSNAGWEALEVLKAAVEDVPTSEMVRSLNKIAELTERGRYSEIDRQIIHIWATRPREGAPAILGKPNGNRGDIQNGEAAPKLDTAPRG